MAVLADQLVLSGDIWQVDEQPAHHVVLWNPAGWSLPSGGPLQGLDNNVYALALYGQELFAAGLFTQAGGVPARSVARWDGSQWHGSGDFQGMVESVDAGILGCRPRPAGTPIKLVPGTN